MRALKIVEISSVDRPACEFARAVIIKRAADDAEGEAGFETSNEGARARLRLLIENQRRSRPTLSEAEAIAAGWRALSYKDRNALLAEDDDGEDPAFDRENADVQSGQIDKRAARTAAIAARHFAMHAIHQHAVEIRKASPGLSEAASRIEARRRFPGIAARERTALA